MPDGLRYSNLHDSLRERGFTIYGVQAKVGDVFRVANMGQVTHADIQQFLVCLREVVTELADGRGVA